MMRNFEPVKTLDDLHTLDPAEVIEGYKTTRRGDPEPGPNRGRSFWFGWCNRMRDFGEIPIDETHLRLVREVVADLKRGGPTPPRPAE